MRYDNEHKERTRQRVLTEASAAIRAVGPDGIGVAAIMAKAGLTHGGFYAHFKSKEDLVAQSISHMFDFAYDNFLKRTADPDPAVAMANYIDMYLSARHRDAPDRGCPMPTLSGDLARMPTDARERFLAGLNRLTSAVAERLKLLQVDEPEQVSMAMITQMVGAVALSRAVEDQAASDRILETSRAAVKRRIGLAVA